MSFVMTHLAVAKGINDKTGIVKDLQSYYLGSIAPDCVHVRSDYHSDMKSAAHFCIGDVGWGQVTDNLEWRDNILALLHSYRKSPDFDFMLGYFIHILVDTYDNEKIHIPFKERYAREGLPPQDRGRTFYNDKSQNDFWLFGHCKWRDEVWRLLADAKAVDVSNVIKAQEAAEYRDIVLHQFDTGLCPYDQPVRFFTLEDNIKFIEDTIEDVVAQLGPVPESCEVWI